MVEAQAPSEVKNPVKKHRENSQKSLQKHGVRLVPGAYGGKARQKPRTMAKPTSCTTAASALSALRERTRQRSCGKFPPARASKMADVGSDTMFRAEPPP